MPDNIVKKHIIAVLEDKRDQKDLTERIDYVISEDMPESLCHVIEEWVDTCRFLMRKSPGSLVGACRSGRDP